LKQLLRNGAVQAVLGWVLAAYLRLILRTVRWRHENLACVEPVLASDSGALALFWHGRLPMCLSVAPQWWRKPTKAMISPSADGEFLAQAMARSGFPAIRVSSAKPGDSAKARAAVAGFRDAIRHVAEGGALVITPDGPRGPNEVIAAGAVQLAKRTGVPVFLMGIAAHPAARMNTWDQIMWAAPFGRGVVVWDGPHFAGEAAVDALVAVWSERLSAATRRAEGLVGRPLNPPSRGER
jgi:lysophospholipid acyltransferase (LPLAT)-like uncharacterized protein